MICGSANVVSAISLFIDSYGKRANVFACNPIRVTRAMKSIKSRTTGEWQLNSLKYAIWLLAVWALSNIVEHRASIFFCIFRWKLVAQVFDFIWMFSSVAQEQQVSKSSSTQCETTRISTIKVYLFFLPKTKSNEHCRFSKSQPKTGLVPDH